MSDKSIVQRLFIKEGYTVLFVNVPRGYRSMMGKLPPKVKVLSQTSKPIDFIQVFVSSKKEFEDQLPKLKDLLTQKGLLWVTYPKLTSKQKSDINRDSIWAYAQTLGLGPVAMIAIDETWSAFRLKKVEV
jgi:predicted CoA-binding protein